MGVQGYCLLCGRELDVPGDPLSRDCGGDCWGCIGAIEADASAHGAQMVAQEIERGLRSPDGAARHQMR